MDRRSPMQKETFANVFYVSRYSSYPTFALSYDAGNTLKSYCAHITAGSESTV